MKDRGATVRLPRIWMWLSSGAASIAAAGAIVGLSAPERVYGSETTALADSATAQDLVTLTLVAPLLIMLGIRASGGSLPAYLGWLGCLAFTAYNYAIFAFSIQFGPLFLPWVAVLGLSVFALLGALSTLDLAAVGRSFAGRALTAVHVLDLAFFLPAIAATGVLVLRGHPLGYATAPGQLTFLALTCLPILVTPAVADIRSHDTGWAVLTPIGVVLAATLAALWRTLRITTPPGGPAPAVPTAEPAPAG